jgi:hypothetical protein
MEKNDPENSRCVALKIIPKSKLVSGRWYVGRGRNGNVALWNGQNFLTIGMKFEQAVVKTEPYYEEKSGCFQPFYEVDEGKMIEPFGKLGWDVHYGRVLQIPSAFSIPLT